MRTRYILWHLALAVGISAFAFPAYAGSEETSREQTGSFHATTPPQSTGTQSPAAPGSGHMHEADRTGTTGPSGSRSFAVESGAVDTTARMAKPAGDYAVTDTDRDLVADIRTNLMGDPELVGVTEDSLHIRADNGAVTLQGQVMSDQVKDRISQKVQRIAGVRSLDNQLEVVTQ
jgi:osmotically-inducible protein OsmY